MSDREVIHIFQTDLDAPGLLEAARKNKGTEFSLRVYEPVDECVLCQHGICVQLEDRLCAEDPFCGRLILHGRAIASA